MVTFKDVSEVGVPISVSVPIAITSTQFLDFRAQI